MTCGGKGMGNVKVLLPGTPVVASLPLSRHTDV